MRRATKRSSDGTPTWQHIRNHTPIPLRCSSPLCVRQTLAPTRPGFPKPARRSNMRSTSTCITCRPASPMPGDAHGISSVRLMDGKRPSVDRHLQSTSRRIPAPAGHQKSAAPHARSRTRPAIKSSVALLDLPPRRSPPTLDDSESGRQGIKFLHDDTEHDADAILSGIGKPRHPPPRPRTHHVHPPLPRRRFHPRHRRRAV